MDLILEFVKHIDKTFPDPIFGDKEYNADMVQVKIYKKLMTEEDAKIALDLTPEPISAADLAAKTGRKVEEVAPVLEKLANNGVIFMICKEEPVYCLTTFAPGTLEFLVKKGVMDDELAELQDQWWMEQSSQLPEKLPKGCMHVVPVRESIEAELHIASYEDIEKYLDESTDFSVSDCLCRTVNKRTGKGCGHPSEDMCMQLDMWADYFVRTGRGRRLTRDEAKAQLRKAEEAGLFHQLFIVDNIRPFICNCCGCGCQTLQPLMRTKDGVPVGILRSNYLPLFDKEACVACGVCVDTCTIKALQLTDEDEVQLNEEMCVGCGLCTTRCEVGAITMVKRAEEIAPPMDVEEFIKEVMEFTEKKKKNNSK